MFDDQKQSGSPVPGNLPVGEPEDMFAGTDSVFVPKQADQSPELPSIDQSAASASPPQESASTPSALHAGVLRPTTSSLPPRPPQASAPPINMHVPPVDEFQPEVVKGPSSAKLIMTIVLVLLAVGVLGGIGFMAYQIFLTPSQESNFPTQTTPTEQQTSDVSGVQATGTDASTIVDDAVLFGEPIDNDSDNLDNAREEVLGTDPNNWDTDGDGLGDGDEVIIWKTDPKNPDTDGDGFEDGSEVRNGYSPTGPGRIFEPPTQRQSSSSGTVLMEEKVSTDDATVEGSANPSVCNSDAECFIVAASACKASTFMSIATFDLRQSYGVLQDVTYNLTINGESNNGSCNIDMRITNIDLAFTDNVSDEEKQSQREASVAREGKTMNCQIASAALISAVNKRNEVDILTRIRQTGSCLGPLADESA